MPSLPLFPPKPLLVVIHLNKTAGTSLRTLVEANYLEEERLWIYPGGCHRLTRCLDALEALEELPRGQMRRLKVVMGHIPFAPERLPRRRRLRFVTVLRHPVERVLSVYYHHKTKSASPLHALFNRPGYDLRAFLETPVEVLGGASHPADNRMTRALCGLHLPPGGVDEAALQRAIANLHRHFDNVLLTERFDEGVARLADRLGWRQRTAPRVNVTENRPGRHQIPPEVAEAIAEANRWDMALYRHVVDHYEELNRP